MDALASVLRDDGLPAHGDGARAIGIRQGEEVLDRSPPADHCELALPGATATPAPGTPAQVSAQVPASVNVSSRHLPADARAAGHARRFVVAELAAAGLDDCAVEAELAVTELVTNVVLHARTEMLVQVEVDGNGALITVRDGDPHPPVSAVSVVVSPRDPLTVNLSTVMISGRGLGLVAAVSAAWGVRVLPGGKEVWFRVENAASAASTAEEDPEDLLEHWAGVDAMGMNTTHMSGRAVGEAGGSQTGGMKGAGDVVEVSIAFGLPVQPLLRAKTCVEDLVRDLRLVLLQETATPAEQPAADEEELCVARRLDAAVRDFREGRRQLRQQILTAAAEGREEVRLSVRLPPSDAEAAQRYREALDAADELSRRGKLLLAGSLLEHTELRHTYLDEIVRELRRA